MNKTLEIIRFYEKYNELEQIIRTGWIQRNVPSKRLESVSDHTLKVGMLASLITHELKLTDINLTKILEMAFIHDLGEIKIGDIPTTEIKTEKDKQNKHERELSAVNEILSVLSPEIKKYYLSLWIEFERQNTKEAILLKQIDKLDAILKSHMYESTYNIKGLFDEFYNYNPNNLLNKEPLGDVYQQLPEAYEKLTR